MWTKERLISMGILLYLFFTCSALSYTLFRWSPVHPRIVRFFYGMMAPYQENSVNNIDIVAEGKTPQGTWMVIDLHPYFLKSPSERVFHALLLSFRTRGKQAGQNAYDRLSAEIRRLEEERGREYSEVRLFFEEWPASPEGFSAQHIAVFTKRLDPLDVK